MHVVHVIYYLDIGGGEIFLRGLARSLASRGVTQHVLTVGPRGCLADELETAGIPVLAFNKSSKAGLLTLLRLSSTMRRLHPDVVQTHGEAGVFWGVPAARLAGIPSVSLVYQTREETRLKTLATRALLRIPDGVIAGSRAAAEFARTQLRTPGEQLRTIYCGIETVEDASPAPSREQSGEWPVLVTVGRLVPAKGHRVLLDAFVAIRRHHPNARLVIVGDGPERRRLERHAADLGVDNVVTFAGTQYPTRAVLAGADLFVFPSLNEPQGLALLEAYAAGIPVVASRTGGIPEMLDDGVDGLLAEPGDAASLADAVARFLQDGSLRSSCAAHARGRLPAFDVRELAGEYAEIYRNLQASRVGSEPRDRSRAAQSSRQ